MKPRTLSKVNLRAYRAISDHRHNRLVGAVASGARKYLAAFDHSSADARYNGEYDLLDRLATEDPWVIIDCGANVGSWTIAARNRFPQATIHAFEPIPATLAELQTAVAGDPLVIVHQFALSDSEGTASMGVNSADSATASLTTLASDAGRRQVEVKLTTGDRFMAEQALDRIHFLKIDAEGHDLAVLRGFRAALSRQLISIVQFEVSGWNAVSRTWIFDFYDLLTGFGYDVGRIVPGAVQLRPYDPSIEDFSRTGNFAAVVRSDAGLTAGVAGKVARSHRSQKSP